MKKIDKVKKELIDDAINGSNNFWNFNFSDNYLNPRWIEWSLNSETWVVCSGKCKCGNQNILTTGSFEKALDYFTDAEILNYYKQQEAA